MLVAALLAECLYQYDDDWVQRVYLLGLHS
jgi:hypothetical protein